jgi:hypothetical protein
LNLNDNSRSLSSVTMMSISIVSIPKNVPQAPSDYPVIQWTLSVAERTEPVGVLAQFVHSSGFRRRRGVYILNFFVLRGL